LPANFSLSTTSASSSTSTSASTSTPIAPEIPILAIFPLFLSVLSVAVILRHRKTSKLSE
jgi:hypothetical protein